MLNRLKKVSLFSWLMFLAFCAYAFAFWRSLGGHWFHPDWTTDDALQQLFPFYKVYHPEIFAGDYITKMMVCYLGPIHYWISYAITWLVGDPIMMGHWVMLLELGSTLIFIFLAVRLAAGTPAGFFAMIWMLHTRHVVQRMTGGLPRGWAATVLSGFVYVMLLGRHRLILAWLFVGCLLHTPSTLICALAYGMFLLWRTLAGSAKQEYRKHLFRYVLLSPLYLVTVFSVVQMPSDIGHMATYEEAAALPEFQRAGAAPGLSEGGRFPFVPLQTVDSEVRLFGYQAFIARSMKPYIRPMVLVLFAVFLAAAWLRRVEIIPLPILLCFCSSIIVYFASRALAFRLYVPDRHLQFPLAIFFVIGFSIAAWRIFSARTELPALSNSSSATHEHISVARSWRGLLGLVLMAAFVYAGSGSSLSGSANFNYYRWERGKGESMKIFDWIARNTPPTSLFAGHPTAIDPLQLFGMRKAYVTTETSHPFYSKYREEMRRRLAVTFRAVYASDLKSLVEVLEPEKVDYFVFSKKLYYPEELAKAKYFPPHTALIRELTQKPWDAYAYRELPIEIRGPMKKEVRAKYPFLAYWDDAFVMVDIIKLREQLNANGGEG